MMSKKLIDENKYQSNVNRDEESGEGKKMKNSALTSILKSGGREASNFHGRLEVKYSKVHFYS